MLTITGRGTFTPSGISPQQIVKYTPQLWTKTPNYSLLLIVQHSLEHNDNLMKAPDIRPILR